MIVRGKAALPFCFRCDEQLTIHMTEDERSPDYGRMYWRCNSVHIAPQPPSSRPHRPPPTRPRASPNARTNTHQPAQSPKAPLAQHTEGMERGVGGGEGGPGREREDTRG